MDATLGEQNQFQRCTRDYGYLNGVERVVEVVEGRKGRVGERSGGGGVGGGGSGGAEKEVVEKEGWSK